MIHSVQELIFVDKASDDKVDQSKERHKFSFGENAIHYTYDKYKECLRQEKSIAKHRWLNKLGVILALISKEC